MQRRMIGPWVMAGVLVAMAGVLGTVGCSSKKAEQKKAVEKAMNTHELLNWGVLKKDATGGLHVTSVGLGLEFDIVGTADRDTAPNTYKTTWFGKEVKVLFQPIKGGAFSEKDLELQLKAMREEGKTVSGRMVDVKWGNRGELKGYEILTKLAPNAGTVPNVQGGAKATDDEGADSYSTFAVMIPVKPTPVMLAGSGDKVAASDVVRNIMLRARPIGGKPGMPKAPGPQPASRTPAP